MNKKKIIEQAKRANEWLDSDEGQASLEQALEECRERIEELREQRKVDPRQLDEPLEF